MRNHLNLLDILFGCWHRHLSFPMSAKRGQNRPKAARETGIYVVCLDCGKEFSYDWEQMRVLAEGEKPLIAQPGLALKPAVKH